MKRAWLLLTVCVTLMAGRALGETYKFAVVVGNNRGHDPARPLRFAEQDAEKFYTVLTSLGGVPRQNTALILGQDEEAVWRSFQHIEQKIETLGKDPTARTLLIFYYSGHAEGDVLELNETSLKMARLLDHLRRSAADVRLAFLDSCRSGKLVTMKGGRRGPGYNIALTDEIASRGYAIVTSSADNELSQESSEIRGAFFTHYLISALRGAGDSSSDGKVTLSEAYGYAYSRTLARTSVTIGGSQHPMYEFRLEGRGDVVLTRTSRAASRLAVRLPESGRLIVLDSVRQVIVAETQIESEQTIQVALGPGTFITYLVTPDGKVRAAPLELLPGESALLDERDFQSIALEQTVEKGGLFDDGPRFVHSLSAGGLWRLWPLTGATSSFGATLFYRAASSAGWQPTARLTWSTRADVGVSRGYNDVGLLAGMGYVLELSRVAFRGELLAGYEHLLQDPDEGKKRHSSGFNYLALLGASLAAPPLVVSLDAGVGGRTFQVIGKGWVHRLDGQIIVGFGWQWGER
jgi:hypothetical protein